MQDTCQNYTSTVHSSQHTVKTLTQSRGKVEDCDYERKREDGDHPFSKTQIPVLLLLFAINNSNQLNRISVES